MLLLLWFDFNFTVSSMIRGQILMFVKKFNTLFESFSNPFVGVGVSLTVVDFYFWINYECTGDKRKLWIVLKSVI